jgi:uncharacterized protein DUF927
MTNFNVEVELEPGLKNYRLPLSPSPEEVSEATRQSWRFLHVAPRRITAPLLAATYAAPLSEIVVPDFTIWLWGGTGSYKSTVAALILSHYGDFSETNLPLSFESTSNALERSLFLAKDVLTVVDDWRPGVTRADSDDMDRKAQRLLRGVGNRQGRGRMTSDTSLRQSYPPRGLAIATAEALPEGPAFQSAAQRALCVKVSRQEIDLAKLSELQQDKERLSVAMSGYVSYLAQRYERLTKELPLQREELRNLLRGKLPGAHPRTPDNAAVLIVALRQLRDYTLSAGTMGEAEAQKAYVYAGNGILEAARAHAEATRGGDPASTFVEILRSLFAATRAYVRDRESGSNPPRCLQLGWENPDAAVEDPNDSFTVAIFQPASRAEFVGWADAEFLYLDKGAAYAVVSGFSQRGNIPFGVKPKALWEAMFRSGKSLADAGRNDTTTRIEGSSRRVIQIPRELVVGEDEAS